MNNNKEEIVRNFFQAGTLIFVMFLMFGPTAAFADSLSAALGATKLDGLDKFAKCQNEGIGYREGLIADRLELKLANTANLSPAERSQWAAEIAALRESWKTHQRYNPPDTKDPQHYLLGLTDQEQMAVNSQNTRFVQEVHLKCEQQYGGMTRYSSGSDQSGQRAYENSLRAQIGQAMSLEAIPVEPLPSVAVKSSAQLAQEKRASRDAMRQQAAQMANQCIAAGNGLRPKLIAQILQRKLDNAAGLSASERAALQADVQAAWASAGKGLNQIESPDPKNPYRAEQRLSLQEQTDLNTQYMQEYTRLIQDCAAAQRPQSIHN